MQQVKSDIMTFRGSHYDLGVINGAMAKTNTLIAKS